ncbi:DUF2868 domain-containing protein [Kiritimatiellota bacterium B12222]|nr:DUF2868 domain-containing protein [Kiritimatiellota bacterium B12222]
MAQKWTLAELTELDIRMQKRINSDVEFLCDLPDSPPTKSEALYAWLKQDQKKDPEASRLAALAIHSITLLTLSLCIFSFLAGLSATATLLRSHESPLMNVSSYLGVLIGFQLVMIVLLGVSSLFFRKQLSNAQRVLLPRLIKEIPSPLSIRAWGCRIFKTFQASGIAFNLGVLLMTFGKGLTHDLAFGWATTLNVSVDRIYHIAQCLALPWGQHFVPSLEQMSQSRIFSSEVMIYQREATAAWWPFLLMCALVYGLLPRVGLALWGQFQYARILRNPKLDSPDSERLYVALTRKPLSFSSDQKTGAPKNTSLKEVSSFSPQAPLQLELPQEVASLLSKEAFSTLIQAHTDIKLDPLATGLLKVMELWQPPLEETLRELRKLRSQRGENADILILGLGLPSSDPQNPFLPPDPADLKIWQKRLGELNDPHLGLIPWRVS